MKSFLWSQHTTKELSDKIRNGQTTVILPFGSTEQHGCHLATGYDTLIAEKISYDLAQRINAFILPTFSIGEASHHLGFKGTLSFSNETLQQMLGDLCNSLIASEINNLIIVNGHGGNYHIIRTFVKNYQKTNFQIIHDGEIEILFKVILKLSNEYSNAELGLHAGYFETSLALFTHPDIVKVDELKIGSMPTNGEMWDKPQIIKLISEGLFKTSKTGIIGDPRNANAIAGKNFYELILKEYLQLCTSIK